MKNGRTNFIGPKYSSDCSQFAFDKDKQQSSESSFFSYFNRSIIQVLFQKWLIQVCFWQTHVTKYVSHLNKYLTCLWVTNRNPRKYLTNRNLSQNEKNPKLKFNKCKVLIRYRFNHIEQWVILVDWTNIPPPPCAPTESGIRGTQ